MRLCMSLSLRLSLFGSVSSYSAQKSDRFLGMSMRIIRALFRPQPVPPTKLPKLIDRNGEHYLKACIRTRLATEDYTCRLPKEDKPRIRYKLRKVRIYLRRTGHSKIDWKENLATLT